MERRWLLFSHLFVAYVFYVYLRKLFSLTLPSIINDVHLTTYQIGWIVSAQCATYAAGKLIFGIASDLASPSVIVGTGLGGIILSVYSMAISTTFWHFVVAVGINGFLQGSGWPAIVKIIRQVFPPSEFGKSYTILACTNNVAGFIGPFTLLLPWRQNCFVAATFATVYLAVLTIHLRRYGGEKIAKDAGHQAVKDTKEAKGDSKELHFSWRQIYGSGVVWMAAMYYSFTMAARAVAETWIPIFVSEKSSQTEALRASFLFETAGLFGSIVSGVFCDLLCSQLSVDRARLLTGITCIIGMFISLGGVFSSVWVLSSSFSFGFFVYASINIWGIISSDLADESFAGRCNAFISFVSNAFAVLAGGPLAWLISSFGYSALSTLSATLAVISLTVFLSKMNSSLHIRSTKTS